MNNKPNKKELLEALTKGRVALVGDAKYSNLLDRIDYTLSVNTTKPKSVMVEDLVGLVQEMYTVLTPENSSNPVDFKALMATAMATKGQESKKKTEKLVKKEETPQQVVIEKPMIVSSFPETVTLSNVGTLHLAKNINTFMDLANLLTEADGKYEVKLLFYWTKKHLKQFVYDHNGIYTEKLTNFEKDFDVVSPLYVVSTNVGLYAISDYTEAFYALLEDEIEELEGVRYANGIEYQIYILPKQPLEEIEVVEELPKEPKKVKTPEELDTTAYDKVVVVEKRVEKPSKKITKK